MATSVEGSSSVTHCPLCQTPVNTSDELQLHYLTSCSGYDKVSNEQPRSKHSSHGDAVLEGQVGMDSREEGRREGGTLGGGDDRVGSRRGVVEYSTNATTITTTTTAVAAATASVASEPNTSATTRYDYSVQFMWQPLTQISYPSVTLLASFQRGSVELNLDPEGGHYASSFVNIPKGTYEGQLVVGDSFIHPIKEFTIHKDDDIIILQFNIERNTDLSNYDMQSNPSYGISTHSESTRHSTSAASYTNPMFDNGYGYKSPYGATSSSASRPYSEEGKGLGQYSDTGVSSRLKPSSMYDEYLKNESSEYGSGRSTHVSTGQGSRAQSNVEISRPISPKLSHGYDTMKEMSHLEISKPETKSSSHRSHVPSNLRYSDTTSSNFEHRGGGGGGGKEEHIQRKQSERGAKRVDRGTAWDEQVSRHQTREEDEDTHFVKSASLKREIAELKDHNTALQEQIREYEQSIRDQNKTIQTISGAGNDAKQLLDFTKKQQMEHAESFSEMKDKIESAMKLHDEYIKVSQTNIALSGELEDYRAQTKLLLSDLEQKDDEIRALKESVTDRNNDRTALELETMKQKCEGWRETAEHLEEEIETLRKENRELSQQITMMVEEEERKEAGKKSMMDYDAMMERLTLLQDTRVLMEEELRHLREERSSILQENANLREGNQPQLYTNLKGKYESAMKHLRETELALQEEQKMKHNLHTANLELHQKLVEATDQDRLKTIQDRIDRYKKERDVARHELEEKKAKLAVAEVDRKSAHDALQKITSDKMEVERLQQKVELMEDEIAQIKLDSQKYELRMRQYREERNVAREESKLLKRQIREYQALITSNREESITPTLGMEEKLEREPSHSPSHEYQYGSPVLGYTPEHYPTDSHYKQYQRDSDSPLEDPSSPSSRYRSSKSTDAYALPKSKGSSCLYQTVNVKTKDGGYAEMSIQRPSTKLNPKHKPQVVVKRSDGYETGTLMFTGTFNGKDMAGVHMDNRINKSTASSGPMSYDGTHKDGRRYFKCPNGYGLYVPLSKIHVEMDSATV